VRLGTCIALELAVVAGTATGAWFGITHVIAHADDYLATREAEASSTIAAYAPEPLPAANLAVVAPRALAPNNIFGKHDLELLAPLGVAPVTKMKLNRGGTSLSIRIDFANGARASFKPEQIHPQSDPRREIAAYRIDRLLGIGHVPPAKETVIAVADLLAAAEPGWRAYYTQRVLDEATIKKGMLHGELSWWVPEITLARLDKHRIDERIGREMWMRSLQLGAPIPPAHRTMLQQISNIILYDVLIDNADRWSGSNTVMSPDGSQLFFMDNTLSFSLARFGHEMNVGAMRRIQVFSKGLVQRMRELTLEQLETTLTPEPDSKLGRLLNPAEIRAIIYRRDNMLIYIDRLIAKHGEDAVLAFP
jgi:hypothetical protein